jgi:epoxyqueuosine reductase
LRAIGRDAGLDAVGVAPAEPFVRTKELLDERKAAGLHGGMAFTYRNPARSTDPQRALPGAHALVVGAKRYAAPSGGDRQHRLGAPAGRVAAYAAEDAYTPLRDGLGSIADTLRADGWKARVFADDNALVDREAAYRAGIGWYGKNSNLLLPGAGSWFVLGSVVTDAPLTPDDAPQPDGCGACRRCIEGCPTGAIVAAGVVDARRCLAWLVQAAGDFPREFRVALGNRLYGCDDCQEVCPPNRRHTSGDGEGAGRIPLLELLAADDATLIAQHGHWYIPKRDPNVVRRNALVALGNAGDDSLAVIDTLTRYLDGTNDTLRAHAAWAARRLGHDDLLASRADDAVIAEELAAVAPPRVTA